MALDDLIPHDECGSLHFDLNDDAGSFTQDRHLPMLFLESDCVLCKPCVGVQTVLFSSNALVRPLKHVLCVSLMRASANGIFQLADVQLHCCLLVFLVYIMS